MWWGDLASCTQQCGVTKLPSRVSLIDGPTWVKLGVRMRRRRKMVRKEARRWGGEESNWGIFIIIHLYDVTAAEAYLEKLSSKCWMRVQDNSPVDFWPMLLTYAVKPVLYSRCWMRLEGNGRMNTGNCTYKHAHTRDKEQRRRRRRRNQQGFACFWCIGICVKCSVRWRIGSRNLVCVYVLEWNGGDLFAANKILFLWRVTAAPTRIDDLLLNEELALSFCSVYLPLSKAVFDGAPHLVATGFLFDFTNGTWHGEHGALDRDKITDAKTSLRKRRWVFGRRMKCLKGPYGTFCVVLYSDAVVASAIIGNTAASCSAPAGGAAVRQVFVAYSQIDL